MTKTRSLWLEPVELAFPRRFLMMTTPVSRAALNASTPAYIWPSQFRRRWTRRALIVQGTKSPGLGWELALEISDPQGIRARLERWIMAALERWRDRRIMAALERWRRS